MFLKESLHFNNIRGHSVSEIQTQKTGVKCYFAEVKLEWDMGGAYYGVLIFLKSENLYADLNPGVLIRVPFHDQNRKTLCRQSHSRVPAREASL